MNLLALDTSSIACSVALLLEDAVTEQHEEQPREHTRLLMPMIRSLLSDSGTELRDLDAIVLGNGPGSFIGMRIAASVAQGLAFGAGLDIVPVSSLAAVAAQVFAETPVQQVVVTQDAHMNEVYLGIFDRDADGVPVVRVPERLHDQGAITELGSAGVEQRAAAGFGWRRYPELLAANQHLLGGEVAVLHPRARFLLSLGRIAVEAGATLSPQDVKPAYLRQKVAAKPASQP